MLQTPATENINLETEYVGSGMGKKGVLLWLITEIIEYDLINEEK